MRRYKAPRGMMYIINIIHVSVATTATNTFGVVDHAIDQEDQNSIANGNFIFSIDTGSAINDSLENLKIKTKFFTIGFFGSNAAAVRVAIFGELVTVSRTELLIEWFRKGR